MSHKVEEVKMIVLIRCKYLTREFSAETGVKYAGASQGAKPLLHLLPWLQGVVGFSMASLPCHEFGDVWAS